MLNYINELKNNLELVKSKLNNEENEFKKIDLNVEIIKLENKINFCMDLIINNFSGESILDLANTHLLSGKITNALEEAKYFNEIIIVNNIQRLQEQKVVVQKMIKGILDKNPNIDNEEFKGTEEHKKIEGFKRNIEELDGYIEDENKKKKTFIEYLDFSDKLSLVSKILENYQGEKPIEELLEIAINYKPKLDLLCNAEYPLSELFKELTENKNDSLALYLIENEENIKRLTVASSSEIISDHYSKVVMPIESQMGEKRVNNFYLFAKEKGIADIINVKMGQFHDKKVHFNEENYKRYFNSIKEIQSSPETKDKIKRLLKKLDSLDILDEHADASESQMKEYGFIRFIKAKIAFVDAMKENPANEEKIKNTLENLKKEENKINEIYQAIKEELGDEYETMPSNVDSYRNQSVPPCFKDNLVINAKFNSLFIMLTFIKEKNLNIDNFVDYPVELSKLCLKEYIEKNNIDNILKGKTKKEAILYLTKNRGKLQFEDVVKYSRSFELIYKTETNNEFQKENDITAVAFSAYGGDITRVPIISADYFSGNQLETLQNIFMAKEDSEGNISYLDCYTTKMSIQEDIRTNLAFDEKTTIVEKIKEDKNIENTFYEALEVLKEFVRVKGISKKINYNTIDANKMLDAVQTLAAKIIITLDLNLPGEQTRGYTDKFINDVHNIIENYKKIDDLKDFNFRVNKSRLNSMIQVVNNKEKFIKDYEKRMNDEQNIKENRFIQEFERINREIDVLDKQVDKISKRLGKGETNKAIEDIAAEQQKKFIELRQLQNNRVKELKEDVKNGKISKFYFDKRTEQVLLLDNVKDKPAMFMCDDKNYKNFKTYAKEVKKINIKDLSPDKLHLEEAQYNLLIQKSLEDKRLYLINNVFADNGLSMRKSINFNKFEEININDNIEEMKGISDELIESNQRIKNEQVLLENKARVNIEEEESEIIFNEEMVEEENKDLLIQK